MPLLIISFMIALTLWVYVQAQIADFHLIPSIAKVVAKGLGDNYVVTSMPETIAISALVPADQVKDVYLQQLTGIVDMTGIGEGRHELRAHIVAPPSVEDMLSRRYYPVVVEVEKKVSRSIKVRVETRGKLSDPTVSYDAASASPEHIVYSGPASKVGQIASVRVQLDLGEVDIDHPDQKFSLAPEALDKGDRPVAQVSADVALVTVQPSLTSATVSRALFVQAVFKGQPPEGYTVVDYRTIPSSVLVHGDSLNLARVSSIHTKPIDLTGLTRNTTLYTDLDEVKGLTADRRMPIRVLVIVQRKAMPTTPPSQSKPAQRDSFPNQVPPIERSPNDASPSNPRATGRG